MASGSTPRSLHSVNKGRSQIGLSRFFGSYSTTCEMCKTALICSNTKRANTITFGLSIIRANTVMHNACNCKRGSAPVLFHYALSI